MKILLFGGGQPRGPAAAHLGGGDGTPQCFQGVAFPARRTGGTPGRRPPVRTAVRRRRRRWPRSGSRSSVRTISWFGSSGRHRRRCDRVLPKGGCSFDRIRPAGLDDRRAAEVVGEALRPMVARSMTFRSRAAAWKELAQVSRAGEVDVEAAFVGLVENQRVVARRRRSRWISASRIPSGHQ